MNRKLRILNVMFVVNPLSLGLFGLGFLMSFVQKNVIKNGGRNRVAS